MTPRIWERLADDQNIYTAEDFANALYQIITEQVLYHSNQNQRVAYNIIKDHLTVYKEAAAIAGCELYASPDYAFVAAVPRGQRKVMVSRADTLMILVLRKLYHERMRRGELEKGSAVVTIEELQATYKALTSFDLDASQTELRETIRRLKRFGMAKEQKVEEGDIQPFNIEILPGIAYLVNEATMQRLAARYEKAESAAEQGSEETSDEAP